MMTNLFSIFDPSTSSHMSLNWLSIFFMVLVLPNYYWVKKNPSNTPFFLMITTMKIELKSILGKTFINGSTMFLITLLISIMIMNFFGLTPYIFTPTSHMANSLAMALPLWLSFLLYGALNKSIKMLAHMVPQGTPMLLMPFMVLIETISNMIRPVTLAIRLTANMIAGHLLLTLLGNQASIYFMSTLLVIPTQMILLMLESAVALIQAYVFAVLIALYSTESH